MNSRNIEFSRGSLSDKGTKPFLIDQPFNRYLIGDVGKDAVFALGPNFACILYMAVLCCLVLA